MMVGDGEYVTSRLKLLLSVFLSSSKVGKTYRVALPLVRLDKILVAYYRVFHDLRIKMIL